MLEKLVNSKWAKHLLALAGGLFIGGFALFNPITASAEDDVLTVLCHGIKSQPDSIKKLEDAVKDQSYVLNVDYPSTETNIVNFSVMLNSEIKERISLLEKKNVDVKAIVLVGHSMGGLVERCYLEMRGFENVDKVKAIVMLGTPNHGCALGDVVCYHAALAGERASIPNSIIKLVEQPLAKDSAVLPLAGAFQLYKNLINTVTLTEILNVASSSWGEKSVRDLNSAPDGFIKNGLNNLGLRKEVEYYSVGGTDNSLRIGEMFTNDPGYKKGADSIVTLDSANIFDLVNDNKNRANNIKYKFITVNANHFNITANKDAIRIVKDAVEDVISRYLTSKLSIPKGWTSETRKVKVVTPEGEKEKTIVYYTNTIGMKFVLIPAGEFMMGSDPEDPNGVIDEKPQHRVRITKPFYIGAYEVTNEQYIAFMFKKGITSQNKDKPVDSVWWKDAVKFCAWLSQKEGVIYHLPTEAEWEYACRARSKTPYYCGKNISMTLANYDRNHQKKSTKNIERKIALIELSDRTTYSDYEVYHCGIMNVGSFPANDFGLYDMMGNLEEWCQDLYDQDYYKTLGSAIVIDPQGPIEEGYHVVRGGSWGFSPWGLRSLRSAKRDSESTGSSSGKIGFRLVAIHE